MERNMRIHEDVLRYLTVRVDELEEGPSAVVRSRGREDGEREGGRGGGRFGDRERRPRRDFGPREGGREGGGYRRDNAEEPAAPQGDTP
jgi:small subunit ribosomal protein S6